MDLPTLPQVATRLLQMTRESDVSVSDVSKLLAGDTGLSSKLLKTVNSSFFGLRHEITGVQQAVVLLGLQKVQSLAIGFLASSSLPNNAKGFQRLPFWQDSVQRALFAQIVASKIAPGAEGEAFTAALLQNMALPILLSQWGKHYLPIHQQAIETDEPLQEVERENLSWSHPQAAAWMARNWEFPDVLVCSIGLHHSTRKKLQELGLLGTPVEAVACSAQLLKAEAWCLEAGISKSGFEEVIESTNRGCEEIAVIFGISPPKPLTLEKPPASVQK